MLKKELFKERARTNDPPWEERKGKKRGEGSEIYRRRRNTIGCYRNESRGASFAEGEGVLRNISNDPWAIRERNSSARPRRPSVWLYTYTLANGHGTTVARIISKDLKVWPESTRTKGVLHEAGNVGSGVCVCGQRETLRWTFDSKTFRADHPSDPLFSSLPGTKYFNPPSFLFFTKKQKLL